jgi:hypothetical protein
MNLKVSFRNRVRAWRLGHNHTTQQWMRDPITTAGGQSCRKSASVLPSLPSGITR